jgi:hypothetical protein
VFGSVEGIAAVRAVLSVRSYHRGQPDLLDRAAYGEQGAELVSRTLPGRRCRARSGDSLGFAEHLTRGEENREASGFSEAGY